MIFDALFLAFTLGSEKAKEQSAAMEAKRMMQDETAQRNKFFAEQRKWGEDKFFVLENRVIGHIMVTLYLEFSRSIEALKF